MTSDLKRAGEGIHPYILHHIFETRLLEHEVTPKTVRQLMRYERLETTQQCISLAGKALGKAVELLVESSKEKTPNKSETGVNLESPAQPGSNMLRVLTPAPTKKLSKHQQLRSQNLEDELFFRRMSG